MNQFTKVLVLLFTILYVVSPVDACPGPIDDIIVLFLSMAAQKRMRITE